ncbi:uncharacterized protein EI90DRAFT_3012685 [Cantharellus anzutake]|uniref:uncharacterized protein n=1 Tax=Cantharellus anzutake TaxID=1750568 RepID=UPI0019065B92|nr:uncharacterized protein EI90DRAFT_3012685 [Cantharellus anzutake]KAF8339727.1 hypothetical protein EI90DRAFT_3012685 [Cantharellus anzutake]
MSNFSVAPSLPTVADGRTHQGLVGTDLWNFIFIENLHIIPTLLDIPRFSEALASTLSQFPTFAGRLRHSKSKEWKIELTNSSVPVSIVKSHGRAIQHPFVVLDTLGRYIEPIDFANLINNDKPLVSFKLTFFPESNETAIGMTVSHFLADGFQLLRFTKTLSSFYQQQNPEPFELQEPKTFLPDKGIGESHDPAPDLPFNQSIPAPDFWSTCHLDVPAAQRRYISDYRNSSPINLRFSPELLEKLRSTIVKDAVDTTGKSTSRCLDSAPWPQVDAESRLASLELPEALIHQISRLDAVAGYLVSLINRHSPPDRRVTFIRNNFNFRNCAGSEYISGNGTAIISTNPLFGPNEQTSMSSMALAIRRSIVQHGATVNGNAQTSTMNESVIDASLMLLVCFLGFLNMFVLASNRYDWNSAHFGFPGCTRFHTAWLANRYIRVFRSNPILELREIEGRDVVDCAVVDAREGYIDVQFKVDKEFRDVLQTRIDRDLEAVEKQGGFVFEDP